MSDNSLDPMKKSSIYAIFGRHYGDKLYRLLYDCCSGRPGSFCYEVLNCLGISSQGDPDLLLNQQGNWIKPAQFEYEIGQYVESEGGVIAHRWLSTTPFGSPTSGTVQNYLVVDTADLGSADWSPDGTNVSNCESTWDGLTNTLSMISAGAGAGSAAVLCSNSTRNGKSDWYLPAIDELYKLWANRFDISQGIIEASGSQMLNGGGSSYWSSTEVSSSQALLFLYQGGYGNPQSKFATLYVRAVRKFSI